MVSWAPRFWCCRDADHAIHTNAGSSIQALNVSMCWDWIKLSQNLTEGMIERTDTKKDNLFVIKKHYKYVYIV